EWNGASRWIRMGPVRFQPAELVKLMTAFYMAYSIAKKGTALRNFAESFIAHGLVFCWFVFALMLQPDFGSSVIVCSIIAVMLFVGRARASWMVALGAVFVVFIVAAISSAEYRMDRVQMWIDPWTYREDTGWQLISAFIALARGGLFGTGFGGGEARLGHVPELYNDFVAASIGEEFGLTGMAVLALAYMAIVWRGVAISRRAIDSFGAYLALGITMLIGIQAAVNLWVVTGMLPTKGLTLPFVSSGRSSLLVLLFAVGVLLNISQANPDVAGDRRRQRDNRRRKDASAALRAVAQKVRERNMRQHVGGE
ncbi:MAG: cell division protein FtsW, partial [Bradymonadia bacterium]